MSHRGQHLLAIDCGTQSVRALLFDLQGNLVAKARVPFEPYASPRPGWVEQDPDYFWTSLCHACQSLWAHTSVPRTEIAGVALTTQRGTVVNVDREGRPLRPAIVWPDQRRTPAQRSMGRRWGLAFRMIGMSEAIAYFQAEAEVNWLRDHQPEV